MREIRTSGSMSGDGKRSVAAWSKLPRPSSTLPLRPQVVGALCPQLGEADKAIGADGTGAAVILKLKFICSRAALAVRDQIISH
jgi:hypothetical protein